MGVITQRQIDDHCASSLSDLRRFPMVSGIDRINPLIKLDQASSLEKSIVKLSKQLIVRKLAHTSMD